MEENESKIFLLDKSCRLELIKDFMLNSKIICFDYDTHLKLEKIHINHEFSESYLEKNDFEEISNNLYTLSNWYSEESVKTAITFETINLGQLFRVELYHFLTNFLTNFLEVYRIYEKNPNSEYFCSKKLENIVSQFSSKTNQIKSNNVNSIPDFVDISFPIFNRNWKIQMSKSNFSKIQKILEKFVKTGKNSSSNKLLLLTNFTTLKSKNFLFASTKSPITFLKYDRITPPFWNFETYNIIKKSKCLLETKNSLLDKNLEHDYQYELSHIDKKLQNLENNESFFTIFFSIQGISFWKSFKQYFLDLCRSKFTENILEILLTKKLFSKYAFSGIVVLDESRSYEQIVIHFAKNLGIPIFMLLHGFPSSSSSLVRLNQFLGTMPQYSDKFFVWGNLQKKYLLNHNVDPTKIVPIGTFLFDDMSKKISNKTNQVLFATDFLALPNPKNFSFEYINKCKKILHSVNSVVTQHDMELIVKPHPSKNIGEKEIIKNFKHAHFEQGDIIPLLNSSSLVIVTDLSTVILEAMALNKPVISLRIKSEYDDSEIFSMGGCLRVDLDNLSLTVEKILRDSDFLNQLLLKQKQFFQECIANYGKGSDLILENMNEFLEK